MAQTPDSDDFTSFALEAEDDLEDLNIVYLITWSPDPSRYPSTSPRKQYKCLLNLFTNKWNKCFEKFVITPELNSNGNVHIHGWFTLRDSHKWFNFVLPQMKNIGFVKSDRMKTLLALSKYYKKDINDMNYVLGSDLPIPLTHINIDAYLKKYNKKQKLKRRLQPTRFIPKKGDITKYFNN